MADKTAAAVSASLKRNSQHTRGGLAGRGGAGNWKTDEEEREQQQDHHHHKSKGEELEKKVKEAVEKGLKMPDRVHHSADKYEDA